MRGRVSVLRRRRFDVVHVFGHRPAAWWPVRRLRHQLGATIVADWADWYGAGGIAAERRWPGRWTIGRLDEALERRMISCSAAVTVVTRRLEVMALARGVPPGRVLRLTAGTDPQVIRPLDKAEMRRRLGLPTEAGLVMNAGLSAWDGPRVLDVFSRIAARSLDVLLLTVGRPSSKLERAARRQGWASRLVQAPHVPHERLGEFLACADVVVIPFPAKGLNLGRFPNQAADAMAAGPAYKRVMVVPIPSRATRPRISESETSRANMPA
jgi:glycosyltransferase involved in cell wall biosynthesis